MSLISLFIPTATQFLMLVTILAVGAAMAIIGAALSGRHRIPEMNVVFGWAFITVIFTLIGALMGWPLEIAGWITVAATAISLGVVIKQGTPLFPKGIGRTALLGLPMILVVSAMYPSQWDEFGHWLPAAHYLFVWDSFPNADLPGSAASLPAYPYAMGFPVYLVSKLVGTFAESTTAILNVVMLLLFAHVVARLISAQSERTSQLLSDEKTPWWACATGILAVTILNPTFVQKLVLTAYAELATGLMLVLAIFIAWQVIEELACKNRVEARRQAWLFSLVLLLLISLKQANLAFVLILLISIIFIGIRDPQVKFKELFFLLPLMVLPAVIIHLVWQEYISNNLVLPRHMVRPFDDWFWDILYDILKQIISIIAHKGGYFIPFFIVLGMAAYGLFKWWGSQTRLFVMVGFTFLAYNIFLLVTYLAVFGRFDALRAVSFWRYNTHLGLSLVFVFILVLGIVYRRYLLAHNWNLRPLIWVSIFLAVGLQIGLIHKLRFDVRATKIHIRDVVPDIVSILPEDAAFMTIDPKSDGAYGVQMRYHMYIANQKQLGDISAYVNSSAKNIRQILDSRKIEFIWVHSINKGVLESINPDLKEGASYLLQRRDPSWKILRSWPFKGYLSPTEIKD